MNDDWTPPTDERDPWGAKLTDRMGPDPAAGAARADVGPFMGISEEDLRLVDAFFHELAVEASEDPSPPTPEEQENIDAIRAFLDRLMGDTPPGEG